MNRRGCRLAFAGFVLLSVSLSHADPVAEDLGKHMTEKIRQNMALGKQYGCYENVTVTKFRSEGSVADQHQRNYRSIWLQGRLYHELFQIDGRPLTHGEQTEESKRQTQFVKPTRGAATIGGIREELRSVEWAEVIQKYDLTLLPAESGARYVLAFRPKQIKLQERSRIERILNHLEGTVWLDEGLNILKARARLVEPVPFGFGILASVKDAQIEYTQQEHDHIWMPASVLATWNARVALISQQRQEIRVFWHDVYPRAESDTSPLMTQQRQ